MKKVVLFLLLCCPSFVKAKNVVQISIPKTGTYLLMKCIMGITGRHDFFSDINAPIDYYIVDAKKVDRIRLNENHWNIHLFFDKAFIPFLNNDKNAFFFIYRDPRDQLVSMAYYMLRNWKYARWPRAKEISFNELIMELIVSGEIYNDDPPCKNINDLYQKYIPWMHQSAMCVLRFEDLIGPKGGGSLEAQYASIKKIAKHLDVFLTEKQVRQKAASLFGGTHSFRKGQIGSWKSHFTPEHKAAFKEVAGQLLIDLGYEESFDW